MDVLETLDNLQSAAEEDIKKKQEKSHHPEYHFDKLKMYFGEDYTINGITDRKSTRLNSSHNA